MKKLILCLAFIAVINLMHVHGQDELPRRYESYTWVSSLETVDSNGKSTHAVNVEGATWLRLYFSDISLPAGSQVVITSVLDGEQQVLDADALARWNYSSAYFNGDEVTVSVESSGSRRRSTSISIYEIEIGEEDLGFDTFSQCGSQDNRTDSNNPAVGRIVPIGCTGWIITNGKIVTAGHCVGSRSEVLEFNVPQSNSNGSIVHPPIEDQFPITQSSIITDYSGGNPDTDWAVFTTGTNTLGQTAIQAQGSSFNVVQSSPGNNITITGYGVDTGSDNQTQQTHTGPTYDVTNTRVYYQTDTEGGNSGSPIIDTSSGDAVGVHAYGGCSTNGSGANYGARATITNFWNAMDLSGGGGTPPPSGGDCFEIDDFGDYSLISFSNQDAAGTYQIQDEGSVLYLEDNTWKYIAVDYTITASTILEFDFGSTSQGEIHAVGMESDNTLTSSLYFKVHGTQNYGVTNYDNYSGSSWVSYTIPIGSFYTGNADRIVFINDNDAGSNNNSYFRNVRVYEPSSCTTLASEASIAARESVVSPIYGTEDETVVMNVDVYPNPVNSLLNVTISGIGETISAELISVTGQKMGQLQLKNGSNQFQLDHFQSGVYILKVGSGASEVSKKIFVK